MSPTLLARAAQSSRTALLHGCPAPEPIRTRTRSASAMADCTPPGRSERPVRSAKLCHRLLQQCPGQALVERVGRLARLEEDVGVLGAAAQHGPDPRIVRCGRVARVRPASSSSRTARAGRRLRAWRSGSPRARSGSRRRSAGRGRATRALQRLGSRGRSRAPPGPSRKPAWRKPVVRRGHHVAVVAEDGERVRCDRCAPPRG